MGGYMSRIGLFVRVGIAGFVAVSTVAVGITATAASAGAAAKSVISIGYVCGCSGPLAAATEETPLALKAWEKSVNASGGINGHKINIIVKDDAANPTTSLADAKTFVTSDHVVALIDSSSVDATWSDFAKQQGVPVIGITSSSLPFITNSDFFAEGQTEDKLFPSIIGAAKKTGGKNIALFYCAEAATCQEGVAPLKAEATAENFPLVYDTSISASAPSYAAQCLAAKQAGATSLFIADATTVIASVAASCAQQGFDVPIVVDGESLAPSFATQAGIKTDTIFENLNVPFFAKTPGVKAMNTAFKKYAPGLTSSSNFNEVTVEAWVTGLLIGAAAKAGNVGAHGTPTAAQELSGLYKISGTNLGGMAPTLTFKKGVPNAVDCWQGYTLLKNGKFSTPGGLGPDCVAPAS
jgi:branched-chain amino acid transport system substrate-binding protein